MGLIAVALALGISSVSAGGTVRLEVEGELPCSVKELEDAVALRVELSTAAPDRAIVRAVAGGVEVTYRAQVRRVDVGRSTGLSAARRIALVVSDLVRSPVTVGLPPLDPAPPPVTATVAASTATIANPVLVASEEPDAPSFLIAAMFRGGTGLNFDRPRFAASIDLSIAIAGPLRAVISAGGALVPAARRGDFSIDYTAIVTGAGLGFRLPEQSWEARALGVVETYFVRGDEIDRRIAPLPAIEAAFLYSFAVGAGFEATLGASATVYLRRHEFTVLGTEILTTERVAAALSIGMAWGAFE